MINLTLIIGLIFFAAWLAGLFMGVTFGGYIHLVLFVSIILFSIWLFKTVAQGRKKE